MGRKSTNQTPSRNNQDVTIDLVELGRALLFHWKLILAAMVLCGGNCIYLLQVFVTPVFSSTAGLYVFSKSTSVTSLADLQIGSSLTKDYETVITSRPILDRVITRLNLEADYKTLRGKIDISSPSDSPYSVYYGEGSEPELAKEIADRTASIASTFISQKMDQDPPSIIQAGYTDEAPVYPRTLRTTVIAALIGFLAAAAFVTIKYLLNDSIITPEDVQEKLGLNVLASLPLEAEGGSSTRSRRRRSGFLSGKRKVS